MLWLLSCVDVGPTEVVSDTRYPVGDAEVREVIERQPTLHDPVFERTYTLVRGLRTTTIAAYSDEGQTGIDPARPPTLHGERIVVRSGAHALIHTPGAGTEDVTLWRAPDLDHRSLNAHYDVYAAEVDLSQTPWRVRFDRTAQPGTPAATLRSTDQGASWRAEPLR